MASALQGLAERKGSLDDEDVKTLLNAIERFGKGRVAQRLAGKIDIERCPAYVKDGVLRIVEVLSK
jgi:hypothetical protein